MTLHTKQKLLVLLSAAVITSFGFTDTAHASHGVGSGAWDHNDVSYDCLNSLDDMTTESGTSPCSDFATAVEVWNGITSSFLIFDEVSSDADMTVGAANLASGIWGQNTVTLLGGTIIDSAIQFNTDHTWGDRVGDDWWKWWVKDYLSTAIHESGHSIRLAHDADSELMKDGHSLGDVYRTPSSHDISAVQEKY